MRFGYYLTPQGWIYYITQPHKLKPDRGGTGAYSCRTLCGMPWHRPHFTCPFACRFRNFYLGKIPRRFKVSHWTFQYKYTPENCVLPRYHTDHIFIRKKRKFAHVKNWLLFLLAQIYIKLRSREYMNHTHLVKRVMTVMEVLAN
jgi:hypothetical protein